MDTAFLDRFLQLISTNYKTDFKIVKDCNPNMSFMECYQRFLTAYAHTDEANHVENKAFVQLKWTIKDDFPKLAKTIDNDILYA